MNGDVTILPPDPPPTGRPRPVALSLPALPPAPVSAPLHASAVGWSPLDMVARMVACPGNFQPWGNLHGGGATIYLDLRPCRKRKGNAFVEIYHYRCDICGCNGFVKGPGWVNVIFTRADVRRIHGPGGAVDACGRLL